ncbi:MAG: EamA family transporter [Tumebacillaceae bacterium]
MTTAKLASPTAPRGNWYADLSLLLVAIVWGSSYLTTKSVLEYSSVFAFLFVRFTITVLLMLPFVWKSLRSASREEWRIGTVFGLFLFAIFSLETIGVSYTSASNAGFLIAMTIMLTPIIEGIVFRRFPGWSLLGAVLLSVIGTAFLTLKDGYSFNPGDFLVLGAALVRAIQMTYTQKMTQGKTMNSGVLTIIQLAVVAVFTGVITLMQKGGAAAAFPASFTFWSIALYLSLFGTLFAFYIQMTMIRKTSPSRVGLLLGMEPVFAALFAVMIGGEQLGLIGWFGGLLIVGATFWGRYAETRRRLQAES